MRSIRVDLNCKCRCCCTTPDLQSKQTTGAGCTAEQEFIADPCWVDAGTFILGTAVQHSAAALGPYKVALTVSAATSTL